MLLGLFARIGAGGIDKRNDRTAKFVGLFHHEMCIRDRGWTPAKRQPKSPEGTFLGALKVVQKRLESMGGGVRHSGRVYMNHDVLHIGKLLFHVRMDLFGHIVSFPQGFVAIDLDFQIHLDFIANHPGVKQINALHPVLRCDKIFHFFFVIGSTGCVQEFHDGDVYKRQG